MRVTRHAILVSTTDEMLNSAIFRGGFRFCCLHPGISLRSLGSRGIFYPSGSFPTHADKTPNTPPQTSLPHFRPEAIEGLTSFSSAVFDGLIVERDVGKNKPPPVQTKTRQVALDLRASGPYDGRTVHIRHDINITSAWNILNAILRRNKVRHELRRAARHEQKGEKRRRLRRERWRRRFAHEVRMKVKLVMEMRNRDRLWGAKH